MRAAAPQPAAAPWREPAPAAEVVPARFAALLSGRRLPLWLALVAAVLVSPSLFIGFHLDDHLHRYMYSGAVGGQRLLQAYGSPFGIANGDPAAMRWQIEQGYAPWWTPPDLKLTPFRPLSALSHRIDAALWPDRALPMHLHSLLWYGLLVACACLLYRSVLGGKSVLAGLCGLLYAIDYTHGFAVGWIANRNAIIAASIGTLSLVLFVQARRSVSTRMLWASAVLLWLAFLCGEGTIAVVGYMAAYALCLDRGPLHRRAISLGPALLSVAAWRVLYAQAGSGARGSGLYLDPVQDPVRFALTAVERIPLLLAGQFGTPPAQTPLFVTPTMGQMMLAFAGVVSAWLVVAAVPLVRRDPLARFFGLGMLAALVPACATYPHSRLLYFVGLGAMGLLARLWWGVVGQEAWLPKRPFPYRATYGFAATFMGFHLLVSPALLGLMSCSVAMTGTIQRSVESVRHSAQGGDLVVLNAPEFFYVKLIPMLNGLAGEQGPERLRALSFGAVPVTVHRLDDRTLGLRFEGGLMREPLLQLYRDPTRPLPVGTRIELRGLSIEVTENMADGHLLAAHFRFDRPLEDPVLQFVHWDGEGFAPYQPPRLGQRDRLAPARLELGL